jgi:acetaldehyde dehydrogenase (acetylating)
VSKVKVAILGTGNIGCDLLAKVMRSSYLECSLFAGRNLQSAGMLFAASMGVTVSDQSIDAIINNPDCCDIVFDATTAASHRVHAPILEALGKYVIDLTPSKSGAFCIPSINGEIGARMKNINLITCGGQATIPLIKAVLAIHPEIEYVEVVASISSKSAGPGTRANIDEFTQTTKEAIMVFTGVRKAKAIIILNPAEPPIMMHNTIYFSIKDPNLFAIQEVIRKCEKDIQAYVPGFHVTCGPLFSNGRLTIMIEVVGLGDYLPVYSGNLDIITCAAVTMAEWHAQIEEKKNA